jgi:hypothetical protein
MRLVGAVTICAEKPLPQLSVGRVIPLRTILMTRETQFVSREPEQTGDPRNVGGVAPVAGSAPVPSPVGLVPVAAQAQICGVVPKAEIDLLAEQVAVAAVVEHRRMNRRHPEVLGVCI